MGINSRNLQKEQGKQTINNIGQEQNILKEQKIREGNRRRQKLRENRKRQRSDRKKKIQEKNAEELKYSRRDIKGRENTE